MDGRGARSAGVDQTLVATAEEAPREADLAFDRLYRSSRDDVYAYVASPLRDGPRTGLPSNRAMKGPGLCPGSCPSLSLVSVRIETGGAASSPSEQTGSIGTLSSDTPRDPDTCLS
jgi:hypothetical protein